MADVTHSSRSQVAAYRSAYGSPQIRSFQESTASSTAVIAVGQVVSFDLTDTAAHRIVRCSTGAGAAPILSTSFCGVSASGSTSDGSTTGLSNANNRRIDVWVADGLTEFKFPTKVVLASTLIGTALELSWDSTLGIHHVSANSTAGDLKVWITDIVPGTVGDTGGYLIGQFTSTAVSPVVRAR
jgi:hypothetical protein